MSEKEKQSYLTEDDRFLIAKYHIDGIGVGVCVLVLLMNIVNDGTWLVFGIGVVVLVMIAFGVIKKTKYFDSLVETKEDDS